MVLALLAMTLLATWATRSVIVDNQRSRLAYESSQIDVALEQRMQAYVQILRGAVGLFAGSDDVSRQEWLDYVQTLRLEERYPGFKSLSFAPAIPEAERDAFVAQVRREELPDGLIDPALIREFTPHSPTGVPGATAIHSPILYVAPFTAENQVVLGVDMMQDPARRTAMQAAVDTDEVVLSPRLRLAAQTDERAGFIAYVPVQVSGEMIGWLTAAFRAPDLMEGLQGALEPTIAFEIEDGDGALLYSTLSRAADGEPRPLGAGDGLERRSSPPMPGRHWDVRYVTLDDFATTTEQAAPWVVGGGGLLVTALALGLGLTGAGWRGRAAQLAAQRTALAESEAVVRRQATHDALTGLANRALLVQELSGALGGPGFVLAYVDIDGFKEVNDTFGHRVGDALLVAIAGRLQTSVRPEDTAARMGGDEFVLLVSDEVDGQLGPRLCERLGEPYSLEVDGKTHHIVVGASVGLARHPSDGTDADSLVRAADEAMFRSKRAGGSRWTRAL